MVEKKVEKLSDNDGCVRRSGLVDSTASTVIRKHRRRAMM
jgi:predicted secreted Zn-dependent protease